MKIANIQGLTARQIRDEIGNRGNFVYFPFTISIIAMIFKRASDINLLEARESKFKYHIPYALMKVFLGWWGIPWGPIYTVGSLSYCLNGGKNVTNDVMSDFNQRHTNYGINHAYNIPGQPQPSANNSSNKHNAPNNNDGAYQDNIPKN